MKKIAWEEEFNEIGDLRDSWQTISDEVDRSIEEGTGMIELQRKYRCHRTTLYLIWLNIKHRLGSLT